MRDEGAGSEARARRDLARPGGPVKPRPSYRAIDREEVPPGNPIDLTVHRRIGGPRLQRGLARAAQAVVEALGKRRRVWFAYEDLLSRITDRRQAAYFDLGVENGIAAARANQLPGASKSARAIAEHVVRKVVGTGAAPRDRVEAAVLVAWAMLGERRRSVRCRETVRRGSLANSTSSLRVGTSRLADYDRPIRKGRC
jgi:hypothetical protein